MKFYTREGVGAAARLAKIRDDSTIWVSVESRYKEMLARKGGNHLVERDKFCEDLGQKLKAMDSPSISKDDLIKIIEWKFAKGKQRNALMKRLKANTERDVQDLSQDGFAEACRGNIQEAISKISQLNGVGPATASALLSLYRPDIFVFMDDEVIECLYDGKRSYSPKIYLQINSECIELADSLGKDWTSRRVGRALWTAARISACGEEDPTVQSRCPINQQETH